MSTLEENKAIARAFFEEIFNNKDMDAANRILAPDYIGYFTDAPEPVRGRDTWKGLAAGHLKAIPDMHMTIDDVIGEGDKVVVRYHWRGTQRGEFLGRPPSGQQLTSSGANTFRIVDGKVVEEWVQEDLLGLWQQLGIAPRQP